MSVLIKGMEIPKTEEESKLLILTPDGVTCLTKLGTGNQMFDATDVPLYGEWTAEGNDEYGNYWDECTACRKAVWFPPSVKNDYKYCPHCGAKMDGA